MDRKAPEEFVPAVRSGEYETPPLTDQQQASLTMAQGDSKRGMPLRHGLLMTLRQIFRFGVIGLLQNGIGYGLYLVLTRMGLPSKPTMTLLYLVGATVSFLANRRFTFGHTGGLTQAGIRFMLAHLGGYLINLFLLWWLVDKHGHPHQWVQAGAILVVAAFLFVSFRLFVFPARPKS